MGFIVKHIALIAAIVVSAVITMGLSGTLIGAFGTFWGTVATGAVAGFASGVIMTGSLKGGLAGAIFGSLSAGLLYGVKALTSSLFKVNIKATLARLLKAAVFRAIANGLTRGLIAKLQGGSFKRAFLMSTSTFALRALYLKSVKYETDASWKPGKGLAVDKDGNIGVYEMGEGDKIPFDKNIFGNNDTTSLMRQGSLVSRIGNALPGGAAISRIHDAWLHPYYGGITQTIYTNVGLMLPAAVVSYGALYHRYIDQIQISENMKYWRE